MLLGLSFQKWLRKMQLTFQAICIMSIPQGALILPGFGLRFRCAVLPAFLRSQYSLHPESWGLARNSMFSQDSWHGTFSVCA